MDYKGILLRLYQPFMDYLAERECKYNVYIDEEPNGGIINVSFSIDIPEVSKPLRLGNMISTDYLYSLSDSIQESFEAAIENRIPQEEI